ncbi:hypothetical protein [Paenibacillus alvei]|uniref:Uncharacterized protein n=1 Tax=Paenibacillus alvei TaxID=44250 RepID=A0AAP6ZX52_PAEAL|nr:hypothetical protein [Paenibacillus alvei]MBG9733020.1 hypothetical protein [Paenibacillus alvei]MBG9744972.1 hypothetical protein [Paenibacillus alvei]MCY9581847.1 hypothetical protein [Paenibacillus alvei]MCY9586818.1 hypothetical protein [Paenibacillus alvei]NOJ71568.1 hypothetical protein [Paenibacillus alvei]
MDHEWILEQETPNTGTKSLSTGIVIISIFAACCAIGLSIFTFVHSKKAIDTAEKLQQSLSKLQEDYEELKRTSSKQGFTINQLQNNLMYANIQHDMEESVASEHLILDKIYFDDIAYRKGTSGAIIDVRNQPDFANKYSGSGKFSISNKELSTVITTFMEAAEEHYAWCLDKYSMEDVAPDWNDLTHTISVNNYEIGTYHNGVFTPLKK